MPKKKKNTKRVITKIVIKNKNNNDYYDHMYKEKKKWHLKNTLLYFFNDIETVQTLALILISVTFVLCAIQLTGAP